MMYSGNGARLFMKEKSCGHFRNERPPFMAPQIDDGLILEGFSWLRLILRIPTHGDRSITFMPITQ